MTAPPSASIASMRRITAAGGTPAPTWRAVRPRGSGAALTRFFRGFFPSGSAAMTSLPGYAARERHAAIRFLQETALLQHSGPGGVLQSRELGRESGCPAH